MRFLLTAVFWFTVVASFMPRELADEADAARAYAGGPAALDAAASAAELCARRPEVCAAGAEAALLASDLSRVAAHAAQDALNTYETRR
jgi:hypothetical protein